MGNLLSVDTIFVTILGYPLSYIEFVGTILYLWSAWLIARRNVLTWPVGIVSVLLYMLLFYQIRLYSDALEQVYYLGASIYGWWFWSRTQRDNGVVTDVNYSSPRAIVTYLLITAIFSVSLGAIMSQVHVWAPSIFPAPASFPYLSSVLFVHSRIPYCTNGLQSDTLLNSRIPYCATPQQKMGSPPPHSTVTLLARLRG
jgi:nicotinamide mononucleotide transporter